MTTVRRGEAGRQHSRAARQIEARGSARSGADDLARKLGDEISGGRPGFGAARGRLRSVFGGDRGKLGGDRGSSSGRSY